MLPRDLIECRPGSCRWWSKDTVAVVTGSNTGIGLATARQFAKHRLSVVLTARDHAKGTAAMEVLKSEGLESLYFHPLNVTSSASVADLAVWLKAQFGKVDILVRKNLSIVRLSDCDGMDKLNN